MQKTIKCDAALLATLRKAEKEEVDFLVDVITAGGSGRFGLSPSIKDLLIAEKHEAGYSEDGLRNLLHEFQEYGGHSFVNLFRSEPLPYEEILTDVHKKLNGKDSKKKSIAQKETEIVLGLFGAGWQAMPEGERFERATSLRVTSGFFQLSEHLRFDEKGAMSGLATVASMAALRVVPVIAIASTAVLISEKAVGEAYRVTIPFVAQVGWIRRRMQPKLAC
jgi:uncharacterized protein YaaW (UPF0174 family)